MPEIIKYDLWLINMLSERIYCGRFSTHELADRMAARLTKRNGWPTEIEEVKLWSAR